MQIYPLGVPQCGTGPIFLCFYFNRGGKPRINTTSKLPDDRFFAKSYSLQRYKDDVSKYDNERDNFNEIFAEFVKYVNWGAVSR